MLTTDGTTPTGDVLSPKSRARHLECGEPPQGAACSTTRTTQTAESGPWVQVSRLGNPLFNEVIVPLGQKDDLEPRATLRTMRSTSPNVQHPELAGLLPVLYPASFPNLAARRASRADLVAILLTGIPAGVIPGRVPELHRPDATPTCSG